MPVRTTSRTTSRITSRTTSWTTSWSTATGSRTTSRSTSLSTSWTTSWTSEGSVGRSRTTSRTTSWTTSWTSAGSTTSRSTSLSTSWTTSWSSAISVGRSRITSRTTSWTTSWSTAGSRTTSRSTSRSTSWTTSWITSWTTDVPEAPAFADPTGTPFTGNVGIAITSITVPEASGDPAPTYAVHNDSLPDGLSFDASTRVISGTPGSGAVGSGTITIRAENSEGHADWTVDYDFAPPNPQVIAVGELDVSLEVTQGQVLEQVDAGFLPTSASATYLIGFAFPVGADTFAVLALSDDSTATFDEAEADTGHDLSENLEKAPFAFTLEAGSLSLVIGGPDQSAIDAALRDSSEPYSWVPPAAETARADDFQTAYASLTQAEKDATTLTLRDTDTAPPLFPNSQGADIDGTASVTVPAAIGGPTPTYAAVGTLPTGVSFDTGTRILTFDANTIVDGTSGSIVIRATNSQGTADWTADYSFAESEVAPFWADDTGDRITSVVGVTFPVRIIPRVSAGNPAPTYEVVGAVPSGVIVSLPTADLDGLISGRPDTAGTGRITIRATNSVGHADWTVDYEFVALGMSIGITPSETSVMAGESVTLTAEAYGDLIAIDQSNNSLWSLSQRDDGTWVALRRSILSQPELRRARSLATKGGNLYVVDWWGEDIYRITDIEAGTSSLLGEEGSGTFGSPEGATFLGDVLWAIDQSGDDLWSWADVDTSPDGGVQQGSISGIAGDPRGLTVRNNLLALLFINGRTFTVYQIDDPTAGTTTTLATFADVPTTTIGGSPQAFQEYRGSLWFFTSNEELVEITDIGGTPALVEREDFGVGMMTDVRGMTQFPMPASYAWTSDAGGTFGDATALGTTWDSTGATSQTATLTLTVTDQGGNTTSHSVAITVTGELPPAAPVFADDTGTPISSPVGQAIPDVTVPTATGNPVPTYAAVGTLPAGVSFDTSTRVLSFDESAIVAGSGTITIRATNSQGSDDWTVQYTFTAEAPSFADDTGDPISAEVGDAIADVVVPAATGTPAPTYAVVGSLPAGVTFTVATRTLSFDENAITAGSGTIRIRATNSAGSDDWTVTYVFSAPPPPDELHTITGVWRDNGSNGFNLAGASTSDPPPTNRQLPSAWVPDGTERYIRFISITENLEPFPAEYDFTLYLNDVDSGIGTGGGDDLLSEIEAAATITLTAGSDSYTLPGTISQNDPSEPYRWVLPTGFPAFVGNISDGEAGTMSIRVQMGGQAQPVNWAFEVPAATGTGPPEHAGDAAPANWLFNVPAATGALLPFFADDTGDQISGQLGSAITPVTVPAAAGVPAPTYAVVGNLPPGLQFDTSTRVISGTPEHGAGGGGTIRIRATNNAGSDDWTVAYLFSVPRYIVNAQPANWTFEVPAATGFTIAPFYPGDAEPANWTFEVPATATGVTVAPNTADNGDAAPARWEFEVPQATGATVPPHFTADAQAASFTWDIPAATGSTVPPHFTGIGREARWTFDVPVATGDTVPPAHEHDALPARWTFDVPDATGYARPHLSADADAARWTFTVPVADGQQTSVLDDTGDAEPANWTFNVPTAIGRTARHVSDFDAYARGQARSLAGTQPRYALEITHPAITEPVRVVNDNADHIIESNHYVALRFDAEPPQFRDGEIPRATLEIDNVGRELTQWVEATGGGRGAKMRVMLVHRDPSGASSHIIWELPALAVGVTELTNETVSAQLVFRSGKARPGVKMRFDPTTAPGLL